MYPPKSQHRKENVSPTQTTFLDIHSSIIDGQILAELYDKKDMFHCCIVLVKHKNITLSYKIIFFILSAEVHSML